MPANNVNTSICDCNPVQYSQIIFNNVAYQNSANTVYQSLASTVAASTNGTLGNAANGQPTFKSNYERMQYLLGRQNQASCGVPKRLRALRPD
jgi:hypothetical protein